MHRVRAAFVVALLVLAGCASNVAPPPRPVEPAAVPLDPHLIDVTGHRIANVTIAGADAVQLAALVYEPIGNRTDQPGGVIQWPVVVFLHGWGGNKDSYTNDVAFPVATGADDPRGDIDRLAVFADAGFLVVAYDARGFGASTGASTVAGPKEMADLDAVITWMQQHYPTNGKVGLIGGSYGGGQSLLGWTDNAKVTTAASFYGWTDLQQALIPGDVPKLEWGQFLYFYGRAGRGTYDPMIDRWYQATYTREGLDVIGKEMQARSALPRMGQVAKPLYLCQGMEETLFPQIDTAWEAAAGFTRATTYTGGHGAAPARCWDRALDWFRFFLAGYDTRVDSWPALETMDADGTGPYAYTNFPKSTATTWHVRDADLYEGEASTATFSIRQYVVSNPADAPAALWDQSGLPNPATPVGLRSDPAAVTFTTQPFDQDERLLGRAHLALSIASGDAPFQVAATLYIIDQTGESRSIAHGAAAALNATAAKDGTLAIEFPWTHANIAAGEQLQLKLSANDASWWMPLVADYQVDFDGHTELTLPLFEINGA